MEWGHWVLLAFIVYTIFGIGLNVGMYWENRRIRKFSEWMSDNRDSFLRTIKYEDDFREQEKRKGKGQ